MDVIIRPVKKEDFVSIQAIYAHYVDNTLISFEEVAPSVGDMIARWEANGELPYLVAELDGQVIGFAFVTYYNVRTAYRFSVVSSVYIDKSFVGQGLGKYLMERIIADCKKQSLRQIVARIVKQPSDASIKLHASLGFRECGVLHNIGYKFDQWHDTVIMQLDLWD